MVEFWRAGGPVSTMTAAEGWAGQMFMDSQSLSADDFEKGKPNETERPLALRPDRTGR
jgi:hypothetical protein